MNEKHCAHSPERTLPSCMRCFTVHGIREVRDSNPEANSIRCKRQTEDTEPAKADGNLLARFADRTLLPVPLRTRRNAVDGP